MKGYVLDFYAHQLKFAIELDGGYHNDKVQQLYDRDRENNLMEEHTIIIRFSNEEVIYSINKVLDSIRAKIISLKSLKKNK